MKKNEIIEKINIACNILDSLRADLINESAPTGKKKKKQKKVSEEITKPLAEMGELNRELTVKQIVERYQEQPQDDDHIQSVCNIVSKKGITTEQLEGCLDRIREHATKHEVQDIRKFTYKCLHNMNKEKE